MNNPRIIYEDKHILVVIKEAGVAVQHASVGQPDMESILKNYLAASSRERIPYLGVVHRLDQPVEGILVFARTKEAAARLSKQLTAHTMQKSYLAVVQGNIPFGKTVTLTDFLKKQGAQAVVAGEKDPSAKKAVLSYRVLGSIAPTKEEPDRAARSLLAVELETGRYHQIRCQLSHAGMPIWGDVRYGAERIPGQRGIGLCAGKLSFCHPVTGKPMTFVHTPDNKAFTIFSKEIAEVLA